MTDVLLDGKVNAVVMSTGTGGTLAGVSMFLKEKNSKIRTVLADPPVRPSVRSLCRRAAFIRREVSCTITFELANWIERKVHRSPKVSAFCSAENVSLPIPYRYWSRTCDAKSTGCTD